MAYKDNNFPTWEKERIDPKKTTLKQFLDYLTDINWHSERCLMEAIIDGNGDLIDRACKVVLKHSEEGFLSPKNWREREAIYQELNKRRQDDTR